jgi:hypothetical protein
VVVALASPYHWLAPVLKDVTDFLTGINVTPLRQLPQQFNHKE